MRKELPESPSELLEECRNEGGCGRASKPAGWSMDFRIVRSTLRARFFVDGWLVEGLDHHDMPGDIEEGYHWDKYPPAHPRKIREHIRPQPEDVESALELLFSSWQIFPRPDKQLRIK